MKRKSLRHRFRRFLRDVSDHTPFAKLVLLLVILWLSFAGGLYAVEYAHEDAAITSFGEALYWVSPPSPPRASPTHRCHLSVSSSAARGS